MAAAEADIIAHWRQGQNAAAVRAGQQPSRAQCERFLRLLRSALDSGTPFSAQAPAWAAVAQFLVSESEARLADGALASEAAAFLLSLKRALFDAVRQAHQQDGELLGGLLWELSSLLDVLGLHLADTRQRKAQASYLGVEVALHVNKEFKERIVESSPDCIKVLDADAHLLWMSEFGQTLMEVCDFEAARGTDWLTLWQGEAQAAARQAVAAAKTGRVGRFEGFCPTLCGTPKWWSVVVAPIVDEAGQVVQLLSVSRDISEQKQVERRLREREAELEQAVRLRENLLAMVSHDLRTPLAVIGMSTNLLQRKPTIAADAAVCARLDAVQQAAARMNRLIDDLLDLASIQSGRLSIRAAVHDMGVLLEEASALHKPLAEEQGVALQIAALPAEPLPVHCDRERILQVLGNLIGNAIKFCGRGDTVSVAAQRTDGASVRVEVADNGPGIATADLPYLFDPYWSAQTTKAGSGLGLFITKGIVEAHGGQLWVNSELGHGASFCFTLPQPASA